MTRDGVAATVVLDDDPTGTQLVRDVPILLAWSPAEIATALRHHPSAHLMTNTRALDPRAAHALTRQAAMAARAAVPDARLVLRGDSTLRGHVLEEYDAVRDVAFPGADPVLLLLPVLPSAGRVTRDGVHYLLRDGRAVPLHETEYARDGGFAYRSSRLAEFAEQRSGGRFPAHRAREVRLRQLLEEGPEAVAAALRDAAAGGPSVVAVDTEDESHLETVLTGLAQAEAAGVPVVVRCGPAFAALLGGGICRTPLDVTPATGGVLVVCGSYVPATTRQLAVLRERTGAPLIEVDVAALAGPDQDVADAEVSRAAELTARALRGCGLAILSTPRERPGGLTDLVSGERIARNLARAAAAVRAAPAVVVTKGGITSAVTLRDGFGVRSARVLGPVVPGASLWDIGPGRPRAVVFPGNVGDDATLAEVVDRFHLTSSVG